MKKWTLLVLSMILAFGSLNAQSEKMKIAVMDFKAGVGVSTSEVEGLSDMLINTLYETKKFNIIERSQLNHVLDEWNFQSSDLTNEQLVQVGRILGVKAVLVGTVNFLSEHKNIDGSYTGEYNVDVRAVDVESGEILTTAGATKSSNSTYRGMMEKIGKRLAENLVEDIVTPEKPKDPEKPKKESFRKSGFTLRPELGLNIPAGFSKTSIALSPDIELALGYQIGSHFFMGVIGGFGGILNSYYNQSYDSYYDHIDPIEYSSSFFPIMADIRWYIIDHKYSFIIDAQVGMSLYTEYRDGSHWEGNQYILTDEPKKSIVGFSSYKVNFGFAIGNYEILFGGVLCDVPYSAEAWGLNFNVAYRFDTNTTFKDLKWW